MKLIFISFLKELFLDDSEYKNLASWLLGSYYAHVTKDASKQLHMKRDEGEKILQASQRLGPAMDKSLTSVSKDAKPGSIRSIVGKPLGHCHSIFFWSEQQKQFSLLLGEEYQRQNKYHHNNWLNYFLERKQYISQLLTGDFGTGKTVQLEAGAWICSEHEDLTVHYINALDYSNYDKITEDVLDVANRLRMDSSKIKFQNIVSLR